MVHACKQMLHMQIKQRGRDGGLRHHTLPLQPFPLEEPVVVHAVEVVCEGRHAQVVVDQSGKHTRAPAGHTPSKIELQRAT